MTMASFTRRNHKILFYLLWLLLGFIQAAYTELFDDEAYYWVYSKFPAWGYFDHPPMIAILIRTGYALFGDELGVRLFMVILSAGTLMAIDSLLEKKDDRLFYAIALGIALLQIGSFMAVPDVPMFFFAALFFLAYRKFSVEQSWQHAAWLGIICALLLYSKYHGVLVIFFTLISNLRLLLKPQTYFAGTVALLLFFPHLYWQYTHSFPSVHYHLFERNAIRYKTTYTVEYLWGQMLLPGPFIGLILLWAAFSHKPVNAVEKAMKWSMAGIYLLFLLSTAKGRSQANWTVPAYVSLIVLAHQYLADRQKLAVWIYRLLAPSMLLVLVTRVYMLLDIPPVPAIKKDEFHRNPDWAKSIREKAAGKPVVFINSYQRAAKYWFYAGEPAFSLNNILYRRSNYNFWPLEAPLLGRQVLLVSSDTLALFRDTIFNSRKPIGSFTVDPYYSFSQVEISSRGDLTADSHLLQTSLHATIPAGLKHHPFFSQADTAGINLALYYRNPANEVSMAIIPTPLRLRDIASAPTALSLRLPDSLGTGKYRARWALNNCLPCYPSLNSSSYTLFIK